MDKRIVYGVKCSYWDEIKNLKYDPKSTIPRCPHCGSSLMEVDSMETWMKLVNDYDSHYPGYTEFVQWSKNRCFIDWQVAKKIYTQETGKIVA